jgi:hypothetical protein
MEPGNDYNYAFAANKPTAKELLDMQLPTGCTCLRRTSRTQSAELFCTTCCCCRGRASGGTISYADYFDAYVQIDAQGR